MDEAAVCAKVARAAAECIDKNSAGRGRQRDKYTSLIEFLQKEEAQKRC